MKCICMVLMAWVIGAASCKTSHVPAGNSGTLGGEQFPVSDSVAYVQSVMANKSRYVHKPLGVLLKDLALPVKSYTSQFSDRLHCTGILLSFDTPDVTARKSEGVPGAGTPAKLYVEWTTPLSRNEVEARLKQAAGNWGDAEQAYYSTILIQDIR